MQTNSSINERLSEIINSYDFLQDFKVKINSIEEKLLSSEIFLPIVGEFSSGKSTLLNKIIGQDVLPVDNIPTTSIIYEIRFSEKEETVITFDINGNTQSLSDLSLIKDLDVTNITKIEIFSSNPIIAKGIVIVDSPGISSNNKVHQNTVEQYIPKADAILLAIDINQGFTKTSLDFLNLVNTLNKQVYIILTKCDTKKESDILELQNYIQSNFSELSIDIITSSAYKSDNKDFTALLNRINMQKNEILTNNCQNHLKLIIKEIIDMFDIQLENSKLDITDLSAKITKINIELKELREFINLEIEKTKKKLSNIEVHTVNIFKDNLYSNVSFLTDIAFKDSKRVEEEFDKVIRNATNHALFEIYQKSLEKISDEFMTSVNKIPTNISVGSLVPITAISLITETISVLIVDFLAPGGPIGPILVRLGLKFFPQYEELWYKITAPIHNLVTTMMEIISKKYVKEEIEKALENAIQMFTNELNNYSNQIKSGISDIVKNSFDEKVKNINSIMETLKNEKENRTHSYDKYIDKVISDSQKCIEILNS